MSVVCGLSINGTQEIKLRYDIGCFKAEDLLDRLHNLILIGLVRPKGIHVNAHRIRIANRVGELEFTLGR